MVETSGPVSRTITECLRLYSSQGERWKPNVETHWESDRRQLVERLSQLSLSREATQSEITNNPFGFSRRWARSAVRRGRARALIWYPFGLCRRVALLPRLVWFGRLFFPSATRLLRINLSLHHILTALTRFCTRSYIDSLFSQLLTLRLNKACFKFLYSLSRLLPWQSFSPGLCLKVFTGYVFMPCKKSF